MDFYTPAQVTEKTGFTIDTIRYYERVGLLHEVGRTAGGRRRFSDRDVYWLLLLRCLRDTGLPIVDMVRFAELARAGEHTLPERVELLAEHDRRIEEKINRLRDHQAYLRRKTDYYRSILPAMAETAVSAAES